MRVGDSQCLQTGHSRPQEEQAKESLEETAEDTEEPREEKKEECIVS
jgi:hypothetical protein